jgi:hypothetical protein
MSRGTIALGLAALAAVLAAVLVTVVNDKSTKKHDAVAAYIKDVDAIEQRMRAPLTKTIAAYRAFASKGSAPGHDLDKAEAPLVTLQRKLAALPAPVPATRLRGLLIRLVHEETAIAHEVGRLASFSPRYAALLRQSRAAGTRLKASLSAVKSPSATQIRGTKKQVAKEQAAFAAASAQAAADQADAIDAYGAAVGSVVARLRHLHPPAVMRPGFAAELRMLEASRRAGAALSQELRKQNRTQVALLGRRFTLAARTAGSVTAQQAQVDAIKAYNARVAAVNALQSRIQKELARLQRLTG